VAKSERYKSGYWVIKMFVWRFEEYSKLVFLDGDIYFRQSADELFCAPVSPEVRGPMQPAQNSPPPLPTLIPTLPAPPAHPHSPPLASRRRRSTPVPLLSPVHLSSARNPLPDRP
jgi:hypothetical protein